MKTDKVCFNVVNHLYDIATVKWRPSFTITGKDKDIIYNSCYDYYGMPFSRRNFFYFKDFLSRLKGGIYQIPKTAIKIPAVNCTGIVIDAWRDYISIPAKYETFEIMMDRNLTYPLGRINLTEETLCVDDKDKKFTIEDLVDSYSFLQIGDIVGRYFKKHVNGGWYGHVRMITGNTMVVHDKYGNIDIEKSYVIVTEITPYFVDTYNPNNFGGLLTNGDFVIPFVSNPSLTDICLLSDLKFKFTNFSINKKVFFKELAKDFYLPLRFRY